MILKTSFTSTKKRKKDQRKGTQKKREKEEKMRVRGGGGEIKGGILVCKEVMLQCHAKSKWKRRHKQTKNSIDLTKELETKGTKEKS